MNLKRFLHTKRHKRARQYDGPLSFPKRAKLIPLEVSGLSYNRQCILILQRKIFCRKDNDLFCHRLVGKLLTGLTFAFGRPTLKDDAYDTLHAFWATSPTFLSFGCGAKTLKTHPRKI